MNSKLVPPASVGFGDFCVPPHLGLFLLLCFVGLVRLLFLKQGLSHVAQVGLELTEISLPLPPRSGIESVYLHAWLLFGFV